MKKKILFISIISILFFLGILSPINGLLTDGLETYINCSGEVKDSSTYKYYYSNSGLTFPQGFIGQGCRGNGGSYAYTDSVFNISGPHERTVCFWSNITGTGAWETFVSLGNANAAGGLWAIQLDTTYKFYLNTWGDVGHLDFTTNILKKSGVWEYICFVQFNNVAAYLYINGSLVASTGGMNINTQQDVFRIGRHHGSQYLQGIIDEIGVWNRSLSVDEIIELYNNGFGLTYDFSNLSHTVNNNLSLNLPLDGATENNNTINFTYNPILNNTIYGCYLYYNQSATVWALLSANSTPIINNSDNKITATISDRQMIWNIKCNTTDGQYVWAVSNRTLIIDTLTPLVFGFIFIPYSLKPIRSCALYTNYTDIWQGNISNVTPITIGAQNTFYMNFSKDGHFAWNIECNDTGNMSVFNNTNYTIIIDTIYPVVENISWSTINGDNDSTLFFNETINFINATCSDVNFHMCQLTVRRPDDSFALNNISMSLVSGITYENRTTILLNQFGVWNITVTGYDLVGHTTNDSITFTVITTPPLFGSYLSSETLISPQIGEKFYVNMTVKSTFGIIQYCNLQLNDTGTWANKSNTIKYMNWDNGSAQLNYTIQGYSIKNMSTIGWQVVCNDTTGNINVSNMYIFTVKDITFPNSTVGSNNGFNIYNTTVLDSYFHNMTINLSFIDYNLFAVEVNITCEINGQIYYFSLQDINQTIYYVNNTVNISTLLPQKCIVYTSSSDDHTTQNIEDYSITNIDDGVAFTTSDSTVSVNYVIEQSENKLNEKGQQIKNNIVEEENRGFVGRLLNGGQNVNVDSIDTTKKEDRYNFKFDLKEEKSKHQFIVTSDMPVYPRYNSRYPGHIVMWNPETKRGNWIDFSNPNVASSTVECENNNCLVTLYTKTPTSSMTFESIGGTNVLNVSYVFYVGAVINVSTFNVYDNFSSIYNFSVYIQSINSSVYINETVNITTNQAFIGNISNGTFLFTFFKTGWWNQSYIVTVNDTLEHQRYDTYQGVVTFLLRNIKTLVYLTDYNLTINDTNKQIFNYTPTTNMTFYMNASTYTVFGQKTGYANVTSVFTVLGMSNQTIILYIPFFSVFNLYDERTLEIFNISGPTRVNFLVFCEDSTQTFLINTTSPAILITCEYEKFKFVLDYTTTSYYRTFMLSPDEANNVSIYLIDFITTQSVYNPFVIDDLYKDYINPKIYIKKIIGNESVQITADSVDIENKVGAYLIYSHEYTVEVHSDNKPILVIGKYSADIAGTKNIRLYELPGGTPSDSFDNNVQQYGGIINYSDSLYAYHYYKDSGNRTASVTWKVFKDIENGTLLYTAILSNANWTNGVRFLYNVSDIYNTSSIFGQLKVNYIGGSEHTFDYIYHFVKIINVAVNNIKDVLTWMTGSRESGITTLNWIITLLLGMIAIMATIRTANIVAISIVGFAAIMAMFGLFTISSGVLVIGIIIAFISLIKNEDQGG